MSILNITNLTDTPEQDIREKYMDAFEEHEKETGEVIEFSDKYDFITNQIESLEDYMNESKGEELLEIIDNYIVNLDYYAEIKEIFAQN